MILSVNHLKAKTGIYMTHKILLDLESDLPQLQVDAHQVISYLLIFTMLIQTCSRTARLDLLTFSFTKYKIAISLCWNLENRLSKNSTTHQIRNFTLYKIC